MVGPLLFVSDLERLVETSVEPWVPSQVDRVVSHVQDSQRLRGVRPAMTNAQSPIRDTNSLTTVQFHESNDGVCTQGSRQGGKGGSKVHFYKYTIKVCNSCSPHLTMSLYFCSSHSSWKQRVEVEGS